MSGKEIGIGIILSVIIMSIVSVIGFPIIYEMTIKQGELEQDAWSNTNMTGVHRTNYTEDSFYDLVEHASTSEWSEFVEMKTRIYVENGESLYILFTTSIVLREAPGYLGNVYFAIGIDDGRNGSKNCHISQSEDYFEYIPISLQSLIPNLDVGFHSVHIYYSNMGHDTHSYYSAITIQTLK